MITLTKETKIYLALQPIDMRKAIDGLCVLVAEELQRNPQSNALYVFYNNSRNKLKGIIWDNKSIFLIHWPP